MLVPSPGTRACLNPHRGLSTALFIQSSNHPPFPLSLPDKRIIKRASTSISGYSYETCALADRYLRKVQWSLPHIARSLQLVSTRVRSVGCLEPPDKVSGPNESSSSGASG